MSAVLIIWAKQEISEQNSRGTDSENVSGKSKNSKLNELYLKNIQKMNPKLTYNMIMISIFQIHS